MLMEKITSLEKFLSLIQLILNLKKLKSDMFWYCNRISNKLLLQKMLNTLTLAILNKDTLLKLLQLIRL